MKELTLASSSIAATRPLARAGFTLLTLALALTACGGDDGPANSDDGSGVVSGGRLPSGAVAEDRFATAYADAVCAVVGDCCRANGLAYERNSCANVARGFAQAALNSGRAKGLTYDPMRAGACVAAARASARACGEPMDDDSCDGLFIGNKEPGAACKDSQECRPSAEGEVRCNNWFSGGQSGSLCQIVKRVGVGGACTGTSSTPPPATVVECEENQDLYCDGTRGVCVAMPKAGEACFISCARSSFCKAGRCLARVAVGGACESDSAFNAECTDGAYCDVGGTKTCKNKKAAGDACGADVECKSRSCSNGVCGASSDLGLTLVCGGRN